MCDFFCLSENQINKDDVSHVGFYETSEDRMKLVHSCGRNVN